MSNVIEIRGKSTLFNMAQAMTAARSFRASTQHAMMLLLLATDQETGQVTMTVEELGRRMQRKRNCVLTAVQELCNAGVVLRDKRISFHLTWKPEVLAEHETLVLDEDKRAGVTVGRIIPPTSKTGQVLSLYLTAERELRRSGQLGAPSSALTARPGEDGQRWLEQWTIDFATDHGVEVERVPRGAWLAFRSFRSNDNGSISYSQRAWPFSFLPGEIRWNPPRFETRVRKRLGIDERTIDVPLFSGRDVPQHFAAAGGAS